MIAPVSVTVSALVFAIAGVVAGMASLRPGGDTGVQARRKPLAQIMTANRVVFSITPPYPAFGCSLSTDIYNEDDTINPDVPPRSWYDLLVDLTNLQIKNIRG
ncbi:MAG: hypothetical protein KDD75_07250 [Caldilineaceae bacterium]|nr:hypothetical protein [Caldilinea sp.]MCB0134886.1 hypothetical protein [Caldilineaceae bacterium]